MRTPKRCLLHAYAVVRDMNLVVRGHGAAPLRVRHPWDLAVESEGGARDVPLLVRSPIGLGCRGARYLRSTGTSALRPGSEGRPEAQTPMGVPIAMAGGRRLPAAGKSASDAHANMRIYTRAGSGGLALHICMRTWHAHGLASIFAGL